VHKAKHKASGDVVAVKKVQIFEMMSVKARYKCLKEIQLLEGMTEHAHIIRCTYSWRLLSLHVTPSLLAGTHIHTRTSSHTIRSLRKRPSKNVLDVDAFVDDRELVIVLEWAQGGDLKKLIKKVKKHERVFSEPQVGSAVRAERILLLSLQFDCVALPLTPRARVSPRVFLKRGVCLSVCLQVWSYCRQIASALRFMHTKRVMHRDLKPANIMLTRVGRAATSRYPFSCNAKVSCCSLMRATCYIFVTANNPYHTIPYHTIPYHTIPYHTIPYHTIPYHTIPYHTIPYRRTT
jgi:serine/threonine protein kinase